MAQPCPSAFLKRKHQQEQAGPSTKDFEDISRSACIYDRQSKFYALYSPTIKPKDLQALEEISSAMHKVVAWRRKSNQQSINKAELYISGSDDDGEKHAGRKIEKVLEAAGVSGTCVVARWFGGTMLGPVRFEHISNCATEAVQRYREQEDERQSKKRRLEEEQTEHSMLSKSLTERDASIEILRKLAEQKERVVKQSAKGNDVTAPSTKFAEQKAIIPNARPPTDYAAMPLQRLRGLAKARDATLTFLLRRIEEAELTAGKIATG